MIVTPDKGFSVDRRYSDFLALRQEMIKDYPGYVIPPLPAKKLSGNTDPEFILERKYELQMFLNDVLRHPLLKNYDLFLKFISLSNKDWEDRVKLFGKIVIPREVGQYDTIEGTAKVLYSDSTKEYCERLSSYTKDLKEMYQELRAINRTIAGTFDKLSSSMARAAALYQKISTIYSNLESKIHVEIFMHMCETHSRLAGLYETVKEEFTNQLSEFYTFYINETNSLEELIIRRKTTGEQAESAEKKLLKKKEQKFEVKNTSTWELEPSALVKADSLLNDKAFAFQEMFPKESHELRKLKMFYGYYSNRIVEEYKRLQSKNDAIFKNQFENAAAIFIERELHIRQIWIDLLENLKNINLGSDEMPTIAVAVPEPKPEELLTTAAPLEY